MFEHSASKLATRQEFRSRVYKSLIMGFGIFAFSLLLGIFGYHYFAGLGWTDAFMNASMILGGMGPVDILTTKASKLFAGLYALFSGVAFLSGMAVIVTPLLHRFLHKFHLETDDKDDQN